MTENNKKKRLFSVNALDVVLILLVVLIVAAFFFRNDLKDLIAKEDENIVTVRFTVSEVDKQQASFLTAGSTLYFENGKELGKVLLCNAEEATTEEALTNGKLVKVKNGNYDLTGSFTTHGTEQNGFVTVSGELLVPGKELTVSTEYAVFVLKIGSVQIS